MARHANSIPAMVDLAESFDWLATPVDQRNGTYRPTIPEQLVRLWIGVRERIGPQRFDPVLGEVRAGRFERGSDTAWVQTNAERAEDFVNLTLELEAEELSLNLVGGFDVQLEKLEAWLGKPKAWRFLRANPELQMVVFVRHGTRTKAGGGIFQGARWVELERLSLSEVNPIDISTRLTGISAQLESRTEKLGLHIRRRWLREEVEAMVDCSAVAAAVDAWIEPIQDIRVTASRSW